MFESDYSAIDRWVHKLAMHQLETQKLLSMLEDRSFDKANPDIHAGAPVFVTSLPRAGTTLLLELIAQAPDFAAHTYRDMPFLLCPLTWNRASVPFRKKASSRERAHGDGMSVSYDSVEAFEEIVWRAFWPDHFEARRIRPWQASDRDEEDRFVAFLRQHMRKIIALARRRKDTSAPHRYVSKNNANIARLAWLARHFPDATVLIPYREPAGHVGSLARQHLNFLDLHAKDPFALRYMETIGHLEFGQARRPIDFGDWLENAADLDPRTPDYWAEYWIVAYEAVLRTAGENAVLCSYDRLCAAPGRNLAALEERLRMAPNSLTAQTSRFRPPTRYEALQDAIAPARRRRMQEILAALDARALF